MAVSEHAFMSEQMAIRPCVTIGLMIAQALEANGAIVYILGRREDVLKEAAATAVSFIAHGFDYLI